MSREVEVFEKLEHGEACELQIEFHGFAVPLIRLRLEKKKKPRKMAVAPGFCGGELGRLIEALTGDLQPEGLEGFKRFGKTARTRKSQLM